MNAAASLLALALVVSATPAWSQLEAPPLPSATRRVAASDRECAVWQRERSFARSVEAHDSAAFAAHLHAGAVFNAGSADADRGRAAVAQSWAGIVEGKALALRWRPGLVQIGGDPSIAVSRGPWILQASRDGVPTFSVGFFQSVWVRDASDGVWRILYDAGASTPQEMPDRAAADRWVVDQPMADCAGA